MTKDLVVINGKGVPTTTSLKVAEVFGKQHKDLLKKLQALECSGDFTERNFALSEYTDPTGRKLPMYEMTRDGWTFLVMGFTGKKAAQFKERFIAAFNAMEAALKERSMEIDYRKAAVELAKNILVYDARQEELEARVVEMTPKVKNYERFMDSEGLFNLRNSAKALGVGPNRMTLALRKVKVLFKSGHNGNCPKQPFIEQGFFVVKTTHRKDDPFKLTTQTFVTPKGLDWLGKAIDKGLMTVVEKAA